MEFVFGMDDLRTLAAECAAGGGVKGKNSAADYFMLLGELTGYNGEELRAQAGKYFAIRKAEGLYVSSQRKYFGSGHKRIRHSA
jgi:hypothetical protein